MTFYVQAPIFVFREFMRHRIASYNEESGRYRELDPVFYVPGPERNLVQVGKPGATTSSPAPPSRPRSSTRRRRRSATAAYESYQRMLDAGHRSRSRPHRASADHLLLDVRDDERSLADELPSLRTKREGTHFPSFPQREIEMVAEQMEDVLGRAHAAHLRRLQRERPRRAVIAVIARRRGHDSL